MPLDDRIYCLQRTDLPDDLQAMLTDADIAYLQDRDYQAEQLLSQIELQCLLRGITIYKPKYAYVE